MSIDEYSQVRAAIKDDRHEPVSIDNGRSTASVA
jgi:hypothetical protein